MSVITFDVAAFRASFPSFAVAATYPNALLQGYFDSATCFINPNTGASCYGGMSDRIKTRALYLMTAHLATLADLIASGNTPGMVTGSTIDKISVTLQPPPLKNQWQWWMNLTPYGAELLALLQAQSVGGWYIGGLPEVAAIRRVGGVFR